MGIPSFYKHLLQTIVGLTSKTRKSPNVLALDLNCAIYHCVKKVKIPYREDTRTKWESELIQLVLAYVKQLHTIVQPTDVIYVAVDGVAPMAKIRQQRVRRFKSAVQAVQEARIRAEARGVPYVPVERWDTNSITPGTIFMANLAKALREYANTNPKRIKVSPADEPGEGEQKIMDYLRKTQPADVVVYGLDADLIVLALWNGSVQNIQIDLFREEVEFNGMVKQDVLGEEQFLYLDMKRLGDVLYDSYRKPGQSLSEFLTDFVALMNLLGNDFVPHGMSLKIRDEGVEKILSLYKDIVAPLLLRKGETFQYNPDTLKKICSELANREADWMIKGIRKKLSTRIGSGPKRNAEEQALSCFNDSPVQWAAERGMVEEVRVPDMDKPQLRLKPTWERIYDEEALWGADPKTVARYYLESLTWTLAYYSGQPVDTHWYYPWLLPPRFQTLVSCIGDELCAPNEERSPLQPIEQLAMVLPQSSFSLLPSEYATLPRLYPFAWPISWSLFSFGRRFLWECEPLIPLIQPSQIRDWIERMYEEK